MSTRRGLHTYKEQLWKHYSYCVLTCLAHGEANQGCFLLCFFFHFHCVSHVCYEPRSLCNLQVLLELLSGLPPVDENREPQFLVSSTRGPFFTAPPVRLEFMMLAHRSLRFLLFVFFLLVNKGGVINSLQFIKE